MSRRMVAALSLLTVVAVLAAAGIFLAQRGEAYTFAGGEITPARPAASLDLTDQAGQPFTMERLDGKVTLLFFGYTTCPDLCPTTLVDFLTVRDELGDRAEDVAFVMVTVDPERDTAARLTEYLGFFDPRFIGLRGDEAQTERVKQDYGVVSRRVEFPDSATKYLVDHTSLIYVIDTEGKLRLTYAYGTDPLLIAKDVAHLLG